jgi:polar amino acid transport system substrate-binding protein
MIMHVVTRRALAACVALVGAAFVAVATPAHAQIRTLDQILQTKTLRVGINPTVPPLARLDDRNQLEGFDIDVANELGKVMGSDVRVEFVQLGSPDRIPFVSTGRVDIVMGGMTRTPARALVIDFTVPISTQALKVVSVGGRGPNSQAEVNRPETHFIQVRGTIGVPWIQANAPRAQVTLLDNYPDAFRALAQGRGNAMVDVADSLRVVHMRNHPNVTWNIMPEVLDSFFVGIGVARGNHALRDWLNVAIFELHKSGFVDRTWRKWYGAPMGLPLVPNPFF